MNDKVRIVIDYDRDADSLHVQIVNPGDPPISHEQAKQLLERARFLMHGGE